jgi:hypothetical protein
MLYTIEETFIYQVHADNAEEARELFEAFMSEGQEDNGVEFLDNETNIIDPNGDKH